MPRPPSTEDGEATDVSELKSYIGDWTGLLVEETRIRAQDFWWLGLDVAAQIQWYLTKWWKVRKETHELQRELAAMREGR